MKTGEALGLLIGIAGICITLYEWEHRETRSKEIEAKTIVYSYGIDSRWFPKSFTSLKLSGKGFGAESHDVELARPDVWDAQDIIYIHVENTGNLPTKELTASIRTSEQELPHYSVTMSPSMDVNTEAEGENLVIRLKSALGARQSMNIAVAFDSIKAHKETVSGFKIERAYVQSEVGPASKIPFDSLRDSFTLPMDDQ